MSLISKLQPLVENTLGESEKEFVSGVVGGNRPSEYSLSPFLWNHYFEHHQIDCDYLSFDVPSKKKLFLFLDELIESNKLIDLSVTNPYKKLVFDYLLKKPMKVNFSKSAFALKSVNHLIYNSVTDEYHGVNTDGLGLVQVLKKNTSENHNNVLLIGAGETAKSIAYECVIAGYNVTIVNRTYRKAKRLVKFLKQYSGDTQKIESVKINKLNNLQDNFEILILAITDGGEEFMKNVPGKNSIKTLINVLYGKKQNTLSSPQVGKFSGLHLLFNQFKLATTYLVGSENADIESENNYWEKLSQYFYLENS